MRRNRKYIKLCKVPFNELYLLNSDCIRKKDYGVANLNFFGGNVKYELYDDEFVDTEKYYDDLFQNPDTEKKEVIFLYEMMMGFTKSKIIYPGLDSCIGITIVLKDNTKMGIHFTKPYESESATKRYCTYIQNLCSFFKIHEKDVRKVLIGVKENINDIKAHLSDAFTIVNIKTVFETNKEMIQKIFTAANLQINFAENEDLSLTNVPGKTARIVSNEPNILYLKTIDAKSICLINNCKENHLDY